jgi:hypothetical protein
MRHKGSTTVARGADRYQAPELISARHTTEDEGLSNESYTDREIIYSKQTTKTDVYAFAMVALEVCPKILPSIHAYLCTNSVSYEVWITINIVHLRLSKLIFFVL